MKPVRMVDCVGLWRRTLLIDTDGSSDATTDVRWLQGRTAFVDLRRPADPQAWDGFAGWLRQDGDVFTWDRFAGLQAQDNPDAGRMHWDGDTLVESGVHADYVEHWVLEPAPGPCWALSLSAPGEQALLVRVGELFGWASSGAGTTEISLGAVAGASWRITDSSDPTRHGVDLAPRVQGSELAVTDRIWTITDSEGEVEP